jgi:hypothetical protein
MRAPSARSSYALSSSLPHPDLSHAKAAIDIELVDSTVQITSTGRLALIGRPI